MLKKKKNFPRGVKKGCSSVTERPTGPRDHQNFFLFRSDILCCDLVVPLPHRKKSPSGSEKCIYGRKKVIPEVKSQKVKKIKLCSYGLFSVKNKLDGCLGPPHWIFMHF